MPAIATRLAGHPAYSYRGDPALEAFPDDKPIILFDGVCALCSSFVRFVVRRDRHARFRFIAAQSTLGQALFAHYHLDPVAFETNLLIVDGRAFGKLDAVAGIMQRLGSGWRIAAVAALLPTGLADWLYDRIALNRYRLFGRYETCLIPDANWRDRVLE